MHRLCNDRSQVFARLEEVLAADSKKRRKLQEEYQKAVTQVKEKHALQQKLPQSKANFAKLSAELKRVEAVVAALTIQKSFFAELLGQGRSRGGNSDHKRNRYEVLERVRRVSSLTAEQNG